MSRRTTWETIYHRFDPQRPAEEQAWRVDRPKGPTWSIAKELNRPFVERPPRLLLSGTIGTGKSTELLYLAESRSRRDFVLLVDLHAHFQDTVGDPRALDHIEPWEVCALVGLAAVKAVDVLPRWQGASISEFAAAWQALTRDDESGARIDIAKLASSMFLIASPLLDGGAATAASALRRLAGSGQWNVRIGIPGRKRRTDQDDAVRRLIEAVNLVLKEAAATVGHRPLVILDGFDRIQDLEHGARLFIESTVLSRLDCALVMTAPYSLRHRTEFSEVRGFSPKKLVNAPVLDHESPRDESRPGPGVEFMCRLYRERVKDLEGRDTLISDGLLERLARYSGGVPRDFVRFVSEAAGLAWDADAETLDDGVITEVLDSQRRLKETGIFGQHERVLRRVMADPHTRPERDDFVEELLLTGRLLPYPNRSEWFYPHPLLLLGLLSDA